MSCEIVSCSDCKLEMIERRWSQLLLNWLNKCVLKNTKSQLNYWSLTEVINKYKADIRYNDLEKAIISSQDVEGLVEYNFPILRLRNLCEASDFPKKVYILTSILLYYCCMKSKSGKVDADICEKLNEEDQEMILKFCESLNKMEATIHNVECAIKAACNTSNKSSVKNESDVSPQANDDSMNSSMKTCPSITSDLSHVIDQPKKTTVLQFKSSITILPSVATAASVSGSTFEGLSSELNVAFDRMNCEQVMLASSDSKENAPFKGDSYPLDSIVEYVEAKGSSDHYCQSNCSCGRCSPTGPCCGDAGNSMDMCEDPCYKPGIYRHENKYKLKRGFKFYAIISASVMSVILVIFLCTIPLWSSNKQEELTLRVLPVFKMASPGLLDWVWQCEDNFCHKVFHPTSKIVYSSFGRCTLLCMGPQLWPYPIGHTYFSKSLVALTTRKLEYKFQTPSDAVHEYLAEAFKEFLKVLIRLEKSDKKSSRTQDLIVKKMVIQIVIESDKDPRLRINTDESYTVNVDSVQNEAHITISAVSFCGARHGLETLSQLIVLDKATGNLITLSNVIIKDSPTYKYRGLMVDTGRNFIPTIDLIRTIDAMAMCKLNTFHWRISDVASFPLKLPKLPDLSEYGPYDRSMVYSKDDVKEIVNRAGKRGIRVLIEVAAPGPVGRPWSKVPDASCTRKNDNYTCDNIVCLRLSMRDSIFDVLQDIYREIIEMTNVDDIFHLSDGIFSMTNCYTLIDDREGFLEKALVRLKLANKGFLPKLPIIWYTEHLTRDYEAKSWDRLGVQLYDLDPNGVEHHLRRFRVIHSTKWDLSCGMKKQKCVKYRTWQEMYAWKFWKNIEVFTSEGGESILWTDLVDSGNLDYHLWPRAAAVSERLWSDIIANATANKYVYMRLDIHRWRMLLHGIKVQSIWPGWCSFNPSLCFNKIK